MTQGNPVNRLCTGCGACVSHDPANLKMGWNAIGFLVPQSNGETISAEAIKVCPFNPNPDEQVRDEDVLAEAIFPNPSRHDSKIGHFHDTYIGYSKEYRENSSSGGIATWVCAQLLKRKLVEHLFIVTEVNGGFGYQFLSDSKQIAQISKTRYYPVTLEQLFLRIGEIDGRVAVSGVACFIKAIRLKQHYQPELREKIPFLLGIVCGGWKSRAFTDFLAKSAGIADTYSSAQYRIKNAESTASDYSFGARDAAGKWHQMRMAQVGDMWGTGLFKNEACDYCTDVMAELADISLGDAWLPEQRKDGMGNSIIVTRSELANQLIRAGITSGALNVASAQPTKIIQSQRASFSHRHDAIWFRSRRADFSIPQPRQRLKKYISPSYTLVQLQRELTRSRSLLLWHNTPDLTRFNKAMRRHLLLLKWLTRLHHKLRRFGL